MRSGAWRSILGTSEYFVRHIKFGVRDMPTVAFTEGEVLPPISQTEDEEALARQDLKEGVKNGIYEEVGRAHALEQVRQGRLVSSAFLVRQGDGKKGRFNVILSKQSQHWPKGSIKKETLPSFALEAEKGDYLLSFDIRAGYRQFCIHPEVRDFFLFHHEGRYYRFVALQFGWGRSPLWFTKILGGFLRYLRMKCKYRVLPYVGLYGPNHSQTFFHDEITCT